MELWIRTQDKETILKTDRLDYDFSDGHHRIMANTFETLIAEYKTKKRALEVLDEINGIKCYKYMANLDWNAFVRSIYETKTTEEQKLLLSMMNTYQRPKEG